MPNNIQQAVFIHGDMRVGFWKHYLIKGATFVGHGKTREQYAQCLSAGAFIPAPERLDFIEGDVYFVDQKAMDSLDLMQGHPFWCFRETVPIDMAGGTVSAWLYLSRNSAGRMQSSTPSWMAVVPDNMHEAAFAAEGAGAGNGQARHSAPKEATW